MINDVAVHLIRTITFQYLFDLLLIFNPSIRVPYFALNSSSLVTSSHRLSILNLITIARDVRPNNAKLKHPSSTCEEKFALICKTHYQSAYLIEVYQACNEDDWVLLKHESYRHIPEDMGLDLLTQRL